MELHNEMCSLTLEIDDFLFKFSDILQIVEYSNLDESIKNDLQASKELLTSARDLILSTLKKY